MTTRTTPLQWTCCLFLLTSLATAILPASVVGADEIQMPREIKLWPDGAPEAVGTEPADVPTLTLYPASGRSNRHCGIVICPGGGYGHLAVEHEGMDIAAWFNSQGISAYVLKYRLAPRYKHPAPLQDVQRAIRYVRSHADELKIQPNRIGVLGFSAGGHLASTAATHFDPGQSAAHDRIEQASCRPDFAILCYPVITFTDAVTHRGSRRNLLGENPSEEMIELLSSEKQVTAETPPTFLFHTWEDTGVPPLNSVLVYQAMLKHGVKGELHIFQPGRHGVGLGLDIPGTGQWNQLAVQWIKSNGWMEKPASK